CLVSKKRRFFFLYLCDKIFGVAQPEKGGVAFFVSDLDVMALVFLHLFDDFLFLVLHREGKYIGAAQSLGNLSFPGFYRHTPTTKLDKLPGAVPLTERDVVNKGKVSRCPQYNDSDKDDQEFFH